LAASVAIDPDGCLTLDARVNPIIARGDLAECLTTGWPLSTASIASASA
jgi:hypothetical protein